MWQTTSREWDERITYSEVRLLFRHTAAPLSTLRRFIKFYLDCVGAVSNCLIAELIIRLSQKPSSQLNCVVTSRHKLTLRTAACWLIVRTAELLNILNRAANDPSVITITEKAPAKATILNMA